MAAIIPPMKWAQRKESVFITINVTDIMDPKVEVNASHLTFMGRTKDNEYAVTLNFYKDINPEKSKWSCTPRCVQFHLVKDTDESWPQLLKNKNEYKNLLQIDWALWADSDDEDEDGGMNNFQLPANFQELMKQYKPEEGEDDHCECGHDHCECEHDHCDCGHDHQCDSDDEDCDCESDTDSGKDDMPELEEDN